MPAFNKIQVEYSPSPYKKTYTRRKHKKNFASANIQTEGKLMQDVLLNHLSPMKITSSIKTLSCKMFSHYAEQKQTTVSMNSMD